MTWPIMLYVFQALGTVKDGEREERVPHSSARKIGSSYVRHEKSGIAQISIPQVSIRQVSLSNFGFTKVSTEQVGPTEISNS